MSAIDKIKKGEIVQRVITYMGSKCVEHFQPNDKEPGCWSRYLMPLNRDKSCAIMHNYALTENEVLIFLEL
jgi:hypothetical protein